MQTRHGFTLIELSLVLVIIGLVIGGIVGGREMIENAKVRAQVSQFEQFSTAVRTFRLKFGFLPGDMPAAKAQAVGLPYGHNNYGTGNDDGRFLCDDACGFSRALSEDQYGILNNENVFFFMQLGAARMIPGQYAWHNSGYNVAGEYVGGSAPQISVGVDFPATKINPGIGILPVTSRLLNENWYLTTCFSRAQWFGWMQQHCSIPSNSVGSFSGTEMFTPTQAFMLDSKMDDGDPGGGSVLAMKHVGGAIGAAAWDQTIDIDNHPNQCVTTSTSEFYNVSNAAKVCAPIVEMK